MSSHHIVRENQEAALLIANGEACSMDLLGDLMEWSPLVVVLDGAIHRVLEFGIRTDVWLGDFDSGISIQEEDLIQVGGVKKVHAPDQDKTDLQKGIEYLIANGHKAVNIVWATGRRLDHTFHNVAIIAQYREQIAISLIDNHSRVYPLPNNFKKWYPKGRVISLIPVGIAQGITTKNLRYPLQQGKLELPWETGNSNEVEEDGFVEIVYESGFLLMMECWD